MDVIKTKYCQKVEASCYAGITLMKSIYYTKYIPHVPYPSYSTIFSAGVSLPTVEEMIVSMKMATSTEGLITLSDSANPRLFNMAKVGLGER